MMDISQIKGLADLLKEQQESDSSDDDLPIAGLNKLGPGDINKTKFTIKKNECKTESDNEIKDPLSIWDISEVPEVPFSDDAESDPRMRPEYDVKFAQTVASEDIYLQLGNKTSATASCEKMIITMNLEKEQKNAIDCDLKENYLDIRSPRYRLSLPLPHPVDPDTCSAEWDADSSQLKISLTLKRELDLINF